MKPHAQVLAAYHEAGSVAGAAVILGCDRRVVYRHLHRAGVAVRQYIRHPAPAPRPVLRLVVASDPFAEWQVARKRVIDADLGRLRAEWAWLLERAARGGVQ